MRTLSGWQAACIINLRRRLAARIEVNPVASADINFELPGAVADHPTELDRNGVTLDSYVINANLKLHDFAKALEEGEVPGPGARGWMFDQVDFIVETIGDESQNLSEDLRSRLLQLLLAIANLNEQARRQAPAGK
jgi:hypothetical protein